MLAAKSTDVEVKGCTVMALLDGGMLRRHKSWLKVGLFDTSVSFYVGQIRLLKTLFEGFLSLLLVI